MVKFIGTVKKASSKGIRFRHCWGCWDKAMHKHKFTYARYMDDLVVLAPTTRKIKKSNQSYLLSAKNMELSTAY